MLSSCHFRELALAEVGVAALREKADAFRSRLAAWAIAQRGLAPHDDGGAPSGVLAAAVDAGWPRPGPVVPERVVVPEAATVRALTPLPETGEAWPAGAAGHTCVSGGNVETAEEEVSPGPSHGVGRGVRRRFAEFPGCGGESSGNAAVEYEGVFRFPAKGPADYSRAVCFRYSAEDASRTSIPPGCHSGDIEFVAALQQAGGGAPRVACKYYGHPLSMTPSWQAILPDTARHDEHVTDLLQRYPDAGVAWDAVEALVQARSHKRKADRKREARRKKVGAAARATAQHGNGAPAARVRPAAGSLARVEKRSRLMKLRE